MISTWTNQTCMVDSLSSNLIEKRDIIWYAEMSRLQCAIEILNQFISDDVITFVLSFYLEKPRKIALCGIFRDDIRLVGIAMDFCSVTHFWTHTKTKIDEDYLIIVGESLLEEAVIRNRLHIVKYICENIRRSLTSAEIHEMLISSCSHTCDETSEYLFKLNNCDIKYHLINTARALDHVLAHWLLLKHPDLFIATITCFDILSIAVDGHKNLSRSDPGRMLHIEYRHEAFWKYINVIVDYRNKIDIAKRGKTAICNESNKPVDV